MQASNAHKVTLEVHSRQNFVFIVVSRKTYCPNPSYMKRKTLYIIQPLNLLHSLRLNYFILPSFSSNEITGSLGDLSEISRRSLGITRSVSKFKIYHVNVLLFSYPIKPQRIVPNSLSLSRLLLIQPTTFPNNFKS